jgi:AcrR family transcriptional regulator
MTDRRYAGLRADERVTRRREQLLAAGLDVFAERGWAGSTVQDVCRAAGLSPRYFYDQFDSREELFLAVTASIAEEVESTVLAALTAARDPRERATAVLGALDDYFATDPRRIRVALMESLATEQFRTQRRVLLASFSSLGARLMRPLGEAPSDGRAARRRLEITASVLTGGLVEALIAWEGGAGSTSSRPRAADLTDLYVAAAQI